MNRKLDLDTVVVRRDPQLDMQDMRMFIQLLTMDEVKAGCDRSVT